MTALEVYSRLRSGQIKIAFDEAFPDYFLTYDESDEIEKFVRPILFSGPPELKYDGHGGYYDQYGCTYDENGQRDTEITHKEKMRAKRPYLPGHNSYFGVFSPETKDGSLAYEIYQTLRQYVALKESDGYHSMGTQFRDPLEITGEPLPVIEGFSKEKRFPIKGKAVVNKIKKYQNSQEWDKMWDTIKEYMERHYPELDYYSKAHLETVGNRFELVVEGAVKKKGEIPRAKDQGFSIEKSPDASATE